MLEPGTRIGDYRVMSHVATGGMGEVYRVLHEERGTHHALKFLALPNRRVRERLMREASALTRLSHRNVVTLTEVLDIDGDPALVMEFVEGPPLNRWLKDQQPTLQQVEPLFRGIVAGVAHAHRNGLVHRDLKPSNILLARTAAGIVPKIADFGIAKALEDDDLREKLTRTGHSLGSPAYMAPEQIKNAHGVDARADIFSLGCLLYELVTGERTFRGDGPLDVLNAVSQGHYVPPRQLVPDLPSPYVEAIEGCLALDPEDRLQSTDALLGILGGARLDRAPTAPLPPSEDLTEPRMVPWSMELTEPLPTRSTFPTPLKILFVAALLGFAAGLGALGAWWLFG